jgi:holo-[acyl-carrier protein] synthase
MIIGIGTDITAIDRFEHNIEQHGERFVGKILSNLEKPLYEATNQKAQYLASRFAAKEALVKALGTGFKDGIIMPDIAILSNNLGRPYFELSGRAKAHAEALHVKTFHLSISHEKQFALAFVVLS